MANNLGMIHYVKKGKVSLCGKVLQDNDLLVLDINGTTCRSCVKLFEKRITDSRFFQKDLKEGVRVGDFASEMKKVKEILDKAVYDKRELEDKIKKIERYCKAYKNYLWATKITKICKGETL